MNSQAFLNYLTKHFAKYVKLPEGQTSERVLVQNDGHKTHISLSLADWAKKNNAVLFILPLHSSHVTQPLDVGVFGPFVCLICLIVSFKSHQQSFSYKGMGLPGLNQC